MKEPDIMVSKSGIQCINQLTRGSESKLTDTFSFQCKFCKYRFRQEENLNQHIETNHQSDRLSCKYCERKFFQKKHLTRHIQSTHEYDGQAYQCNECDKKFKKKDSLKVHQQAIHDGIIFRCLQCDYKSTRESGVYNHTNSVHKGKKVIKKSSSSSERDFICEYCKKEFKRKDHKQIHIERIHLNLEFSCEICDYKVKDAFRLKKHTEIVHKNNVSIPNLKQEAIQIQKHKNEDEKEKSPFDPLSDFKSEVKVDKAKGEKITASDKSIICNQCDKQISSKDNLKRHIESVHEKKKYFCGQCDYKVKTAALLNKHIKSTHHDFLASSSKNIELDKSLEITFLCQYCDTQFKRKDYLQIHIEYDHDNVEETSLEKSLKLLDKTVKKLDKSFQS